MQILIKSEKIYECSEVEEKCVLMSKNIVLNHCKNYLKKKDWLKS